MKLSRSYLLGLGSGLILSALLAMVIPPVSINFVGNSPLPQGNSDPNTQGSKNITNSEPEEEPTQNSDPNSENVGKDAENGQNNPGSMNKPDEQNNPGSETNNPDPENTTQPAKTFVIPSGSTADRIANLLLVEGWISSKEEFLDLVREKNLAGRFRAGSFELTTGMSQEQILDKLVP